MRAAQQIFRVRRQYNKWVGNQTLEDYALRFTATTSRRWDIDKVAKTALGATAFLALEAIAAAVTLQYGFVNALWAMATVSLVIFITGFPISYHAAKSGLDIDLLTRSAGFGYLGSTITSLIYASFTFIFFAIEAAILASALHALLGIPPAIGYILCAVAVIPIVTHGISAISKFQVGTQPVWLLLQLAALAMVVVYELNQVEDWTQYVSRQHPEGNRFNLALFGAASSILFALIAQIGEQVDYLRFMPEKNRSNRVRWWFWLILAGPGWVFIGIIKMLLGSFLAYLAFSRGVSFEQAGDPTYMYQMAFNYLTHSPSVSLMLAGVMVVISQMKINVTNAYAGSIAWSNFFSRLTHSHPGRVVWLVFNVVIALILMELGIYQALESILGVFSIVAISWLSCLAADLVINKPLGLRPPQVEFKRAHLYDINPVGVGSMLVASVVGIVAFMGVMGESAKHLAHYISLLTCFISVPAIAWLTKGRYYLARQSPELIGISSPVLQGSQQQVRCCICENHFELADISHCPAYQGAICSLCCSLDARCMDNCKPEAKVSRQLHRFFCLFLPRSVVSLVDSRTGHFLGIFLFINLITAIALSVIYFQMNPGDPEQAELLRETIWALFFTLMIIFGVISWLFLLTKESREVAQLESNRQTLRLIEEIEAHKITDASLQRAKELAENANNAKSRYLTGISHELRTPLQSILGYAQLLSQNKEMTPEQLKGLQIIRRSGEYLTDLIEGLLDISKIEAGRLDIYRNQVKLPELLDQLVQMFAPQAESKGLSFNYHRSDYLPALVVTDERRLRQILINLLSNAIKYTETGQVSFSVDYKNQVADFTVTDTGVGIHEKDLDRILDPFERVRDINVPNVNGTGLGLTIVRLLTEVMGGELAIESEPGIGSRFRVSVMLASVDKPVEPLVQPRLIAGYHGKPLTVLLVDDEPLHRGLIADLLTPLGFITLEAKDASNCLEILTSTRPDLLLLDVSMPGMNGLELAKTIRSRGITSPIIMVSADAQERHRHTADGSYHDDYMVKPISNQLLLEKISAALKITWRYRDETTPDKASIPPTGSPRVKTVDLGKSGSHSLIRELAVNAEIGFTKGVKTTLDKISHANLLSAQQFKVLEELSEAYQFQALLEILDSESVDEL